MKIFTARDARIQKMTMDDRIFATRKSNLFVVVDKNGASAINPVSAARAQKYVVELDALCPSYAPHAMRLFS